jgi:ABC-2 type transport system ATP-binding protein
METIIKIEGLKKRFGELAAVDGISFDIYRNEIFGLLGPNGAGKTTTINMICGLMPVSEGKIVFKNKENDRKTLIGYCPQENIIYPRLTCIEQLLFIGRMYEMPARLLKTRAVDILKHLGLEDKANVLAAKLSGGMKRRLNLCLALIHDPEILILDEPEAGLDPQSRILVREFIRNFGKEKTVILTTHNMDEADRLAGRVAIMDHGKLLLLDSPSNLKKTIGEGDILEMVFENSNETAIRLFIDNAGRLADNIKIRDNTIFVKHPDVIEQLPVLKSVAEAGGLTISEIKLRENTLEDVFIHLTGRTLRQ